MSLPFLLVRPMLRRRYEADCGSWTDSFDTTI